MRKLVVTFGSAHQYKDEAGVRFGMHTPAIVTIPEGVDGREHVINLFGRSFCTTHSLDNIPEAYEGKCKEVTGRVYGTSQVLDLIEIEFASLKEKVERRSAPDSIRYYANRIVEIIDESK